MKNQILLSLLFIAILFSSCTKTEDTPLPSKNDVEYTVTGKVEKGPFIQGSSINIQPLDEKLSLLGSIYTTTIQDNEGSFDFPTQKFISPYALLSTDGYFFNEVTGKLSNSTIHLEAIVDLSDKTTVNLNLLTHLKANRVKKLVETGISFKEANTQAQKELLTNFGLQRYTETDASEFSITSGSQEAGALITVSSALLYKRSEAELTEYLSKLNQEFTAQGKLTDEMKQNYIENCIKLNLNKISENIINRYYSMNKEITVPPLQYFIDWNEDGIAGNELGDGSDIQLAFEKDTLFVPQEGGTFNIQVNTNIPFTFTYKGSAPGVSTFPEPDIFNIDSIDYTKTIENDHIVLTINPAQTYLTYPAKVIVYSYDGKNSSRLIIMQEGDKNKPVLSNNGTSTVDNLNNDIAKSLYYFHIMEALYTNTYTCENGKDPFETHQLDSNNSQISIAWNTAYRSLTQIRNISKMSLTKLPQIIPNLSFMTALLYYELAVLWENIPYAENINNDFDFGNITQMKSNDLFNLIEDQLSGEIDKFENKKNTFDSIDDYFRSSKDFPRAILAKMYLYQKQYSKAKELFEAIVDDNHYQIATSREQALKKNSSEMIWGYENPVLSSSNFIDYQPIKLDNFLSFVTYTEVLLSLAECEYKLGDTTTATHYLQDVTSKRGLTTTADFWTSLKTTWASELKGTGTYFAFLKRNGLAQTELNIKDYQLLFPIPRNEMDASPNITQNPEY